jgi:hypothetical protein
VALDGPGPIEPSFRWTIVVATAAAAFFGLAPLLLARPLASAIGFSTDDLFILRAAAAATLGYAVGGAMSLAANNWRAIRLQTVSAIVFNALSVIAAVLYLVGGGRSFVGALILVAATPLHRGAHLGLPSGCQRRLVALPGAALARPLKSSPPSEG